MKKIKLDDVWSVKMFSPEGWKQIHKILKDVRPYSDERTLADGFIDFFTIWMEDHDLDCDLHTPKMKKINGKPVYVYFDDNTDTEVYFDRDLLDSLIIRYSECLLGD